MVWESGVWGLIGGCETLVVKSKGAQHILIEVFVVGR